MAAQHTLNASPMQACRSSVVSATAEEHQTVLTNTTVISGFIELRSTRALAGGENGNGLRRDNCGFCHG